MCHLQQVIFCGRWHFLIRSGPVDRISFCTLLLLAAVIAFSSVWSGPLQGGIAGGEAGHGCGGDQKADPAEGRGGLPRQGHPVRLCQPGALGSAGGYSAYL